MLNENQQIHTQIRIANAWFAKGSFQHAQTLYQQAIEMDPHSLPAYVGLGRIKLYEGHLQEALDHLERALDIEPDDCKLQIFYDSIYAKQLKAQSGEVPKESSAEEKIAQRIKTSSNIPKKIRLDSANIPSHYPQGWIYALQALQPLHSSQGIFFDSFVEQSFLFRNTIGSSGGNASRNANGKQIQYQSSNARSTKLLEVMKEHGTFGEWATAEEMGSVPYQEPWIGIVHTPQNVPVEVEHYLPYRLQNLVDHPAWQQSHSHCVGLFALSEYHAGWLREQTGKPVSVLRHPTKTPDVQFDFARFCQNRDKKIIQIGWWLRRINAIYELPLAQRNPLNYTKIRLVPRHHGQTIKGLLRRERQLAGQDSGRVGGDEYYANTQEITFVPDATYNTFLSENLLFLHVYDSSAMNTIVECIARATPILVNPLPAVVEYLGIDYPFYFDSLADAAQKAVDLELIEDTHNYLRQLPMRRKLNGQSFFESVLNSEIYQLVK